MRCILLAIFVVFSFSALPASAQLAGQDLPDLQGLRAVFGDVTSGKIEVDEIRGSNGLLGSGIKVPDTGARGNTARSISRSVGQEMNDPEIAKVLEKAFIDASAITENALPGLGFQKRDYGVSFALFFVLSWELANETTLELEASKTAGENIVKAVQVAGAGQNVTPEELDAGYDLFLTVPVALLALVLAYEEKGQKAEAAKLREFAADAFLQIVGLSPYDIDITNSGKIVGY